MGFGVSEHKLHVVAGFTTRYQIDKLVYFEVTENIEAAIAREKQLKGWSRQKKIDLVTTCNPKWRDLSDDWSERPTLIAHPVVYPTGDASPAGSA